MNGIYELAMPNTYVQLMLQASDAPALIVEGTSLSVADVLDRNKPIRVGDQLRCLSNSVSMMSRPDWHLAWIARLADRFHGPITAAAHNAPTVGDAIDAFVQFLPVRIPYLIWQGDEEKNRYCCSVNPLIDLGEHEPVLLEIPLLTIAFYLRSVRVGKLRGLRIEFPHTPITKLAKYQRLLNIDYHFNQSRCALLFPEKWRDQINPGHDEFIWKTALQRCQSMSTEAPDKAIAGRVARALVESFEKPWGSRTPPTAEEMAQRFNLSVRTLMRRLQAGNTNYKILIDDIRQRRAIDLLKDPTQSVVSIAHALGYEDPASFTRAFRRWYETTPTEYRARMGVG